MTTVSDWPVFIGLTVILFGGAAWLAGNAIAATWRSAWQVALYAVPLAAFDRFLAWGLFGGDGLSLLEFTRDYAVITFIGLLAWRLARVRMMVRQYPWLYLRAGPFSWRER
jgi:hypothetical protein